MVLVDAYLAANGGGMPSDCRQVLRIDFRLNACSRWARFDRLSRQKRRRPSQKGGEGGQEQMRATAASGRHGAGFRW
ncbi:MAG: hypothetical protein ACK53V_11810, partial [Planctomycetota bacterium]